MVMLIKGEIALWKVPLSFCELSKKLLADQNCLGSIWEENN